MYNEYKRSPGDDWKIQPAYAALAKAYAKASECIACRACEAVCPQRLTVAQYMETVGKAFEQK